MRWFPIVFLLLGVGVVSCVTNWGHLFGGRDSRSLVVQTLNLYNQAPNAGADDVRAGLSSDWVFRRERLAAVDANLRNNRPDIFLAQQAVAEDQSPADADDLILQAGSLSGYESEKHSMEQPLDSGDMQFFYTAVSLPLHTRTSRYHTASSVYEIAIGVFVSVSIVEFEDLPILVLQVDVPKTIRFLPLPDFYATIASLAKDWVTRYSLCSNRVIVAGYLPGPANRTTLEPMLDPLNWIDTSAETCAKQTAACDTLAADNKLAATFVDNPIYGQYDRIITHKDTDVISSAIAFNQPFTGTNYVALYGLKELGMTLRYGWSADLRFPRCSL